MNKERFGVIKFKGMDMTIVGEDLRSGVQAPEFVCQTNDWATFSGLSQSKGKVRIISSVLSLETEVCDRETRRFNQAASELGENIIIMVVSMDLPYTQKKWCGAAGVERVMTLSDHLSGDFGRKYGCLMKEVGVLRRAVFIVDKDDLVVYADYMAALGDEPDYNTVLKVAKETLIK